MRCVLTPEKNNKNAQWYRPVFLNRSRRDFEESLTTTPSLSCTSLFSDP